MLNLGQYALSWTDIIAIWGGLTGTLSLFVSYKTYVRDKSDIKISVMKEGFVGPGHPRYSYENTYTAITVINKGRRPMTIHTVGYRYINKIGSVIPSDSLYYNPHELLEGKDRSYLIPRDKLNFDEISYFFVTDITGNEYRYYVQPLLMIGFRDLLHFLYIKRKESVVLGVRS